MKSPSSVRRYGPVVIVAAGMLILLWISPGAGRASVLTARDYMAEMLGVLPPILVLMGLLDVWVPRQLIERNMGPDSGWVGVALSVLVGSAAAGPLYAAFPVAATMLRKGARPANMVIFLGTWATIKIPMIMFEVKFLGPAFALVRLALMLPTIIVSGYLVEYLAPFSERKGA